MGALPVGAASGMAWPHGATARVPCAVPSVPSIAATFFPALVNESEQTFVMFAAGSWSSAGLLFETCWLSKAPTCHYYLNRRCRAAQPRTNTRTRTRVHGHAHRHSHTCAQPHMCTAMHTQTATCTHSHTCTAIHGHAHAYTATCAQPSMHRGSHTCAQPHTDMHMHVQPHTQTATHVQPHMHTHRAPHAEPHTHIHADVCSSALILPSVSSRAHACAPPAHGKAHLGGQRGSSPSKGTPGLGHCGARAVWRPWRARCAAGRSSLQREVAPPGPVLGV